MNAADLIVNLGQMRDVIDRLVPVLEEHSGYEFPCDEQISAFVNASNDFESEVDAIVEELKETANVEPGTDSDTD